MGRPLSKNTLSLLRPTAVVNESSTELAATIVRQESSTRFTVTTADGTAICNLTAESPQPGQMRLHAYAKDEGSYYVTHISKELVTVVPDTGSDLAYGDEVRWNLNTGNNQDLVLANKSYWNWLSILDVVSVYNFSISPDGTTYVYGYTFDDGQVCVIKISPTGEKVWSTTLTGITNIVYSSIGGFTDKDGNTFLTTASSDNNNTYIAKISEKGEVVWQRTFQAATGYQIGLTSFGIDSENGICLCMDKNGLIPQIFKFNSAGELVYQKQIVDLSGSYENINIPYVLSDDSVMFGSSQYGNEHNGLITRLDKNGLELSKFAFQDTQDPTTYFVSLTQIVADSSSNIIAVGEQRQSSYLTIRGQVTKVSLHGNMIWHRGYGNNSSFGYFNNCLIDKNDFIYAFFYAYDDSSTIITKWDPDGNLLWQRKITNADNSMYWYRQQLHNNHIYVFFYNDAGDQAILRFSTNGPSIGSYTEPFEYIVTDAADDGYGVISSNVGIATANISIESTNYSIESSELIQEPININYTFGF